MRYRAKAQNEAFYTLMMFVFKWTYSFCQEKTDWPIPSVSAEQQHGEATSHSRNQKDSWKEREEGGGDLLRQLPHYFPVLGQFERMFRPGKRDPGVVFCRIPHRFIFNRRQ